MSRLSLVRTTSFRLAALYLLLFTLSALALGAFVYLSVRHEILADFDERIIEETDSLQRIFVMQGKEKLAGILEARGSSGGALSYGLLSPDGKRMAGNLDAPAVGAGGLHAGWSVLNEAEDNEAPEDRAEVMRALVTPLSDGSILIVGDERRRADQALRGILSAFAWAVGATVVLGLAGGLWLSAQFLRRVDAMRLAAHGIMAGDWSRRIPLSPVNDDLSALARTFNRLFERIEKLLLANRHVSADIAHDLRKPLARILRRLEEARAGDASPAAIRSALDASVAEIEGVLETFEALLRIDEIEAGARRAAFKPLDLAEIAREVAEAFQPDAEEGGRRLACRLAAPLPMSGDSGLITQMVANLLDNALRHTPEGVRILVAGEPSAHGVTLTVEDDGPGVAAQDLSAIFQRFYRADAARGSPGSGLGLSLVAAIAELHGLKCSASDNHPGLKITLTTAGPDE